MEAEDVTSDILNAACAVHSALGPGMLESAYEGCLAHVLAKRGVGIERQVPVSIVFDGVRLETAYRMDLVVARCVVVEVKHLETVKAVHKAQLLTYLRFSGLGVGLLLNFNVTSMKEGITRRVLYTPRPG
jgi:GxxExxY protein